MLQKSVVAPGMELHHFDENLSLISHGPVDFDGAIRELRAAAKWASQKYESGEQAIAQTSFILSRDTRDFLQVNCDGPDDVRFQSDRLVLQSSLLARFLNPKSTLAFRCTLDDAERVIRHYIYRSREDFESLYSRGYTSTDLTVRLEPPGGFAERFGDRALWGGKEFWKNVG